MGHPNKTPSFIYSIQKDAALQGDIVDAVLNIVSQDGPQPMRDMRPVEKRKTGAETFRDNHQAKYVARTKSSDDQIARVNEHNSAYPKLRDELDQRRSLAQVKVKRPSSNTESTPHNRKRKLCCKCQRVEAKKFKTSKHCPTRRNNKCKLSKCSNRSKRPSGVRYKRNFRYNTIRRAQCLNLDIAERKQSEERIPPHRSQEDVPKPDSKESVSSKKVDVGPDGEASPVVSLYKNDKHTKSDWSNSDVASVYPASSAYSVSTYNSYASTDHECMD